MRGIEEGLEILRQASDRSPVGVSDCANSLHPDSRYQTSSFKVSTLDGSLVRYFVVLAPRYCIYFYTTHTLF